MTLLKDKIQEALDEGRILILGVQILLGFLYRAVFEPGYARLTLRAQDLTLGALVLVVVVFGLLMSPVSYHRIVEQGEDSYPFLDFIQRLMILTLFPFALSIGLTVYVAVEKITGAALALALGLGTMLISLICWYGLGLVRRDRGTGGERTLPFGSPTPGKITPMNEKTKDAPEQHTELKEKIRHVLTEARMVLPGAQALLGFQFIIVLLDDFAKLPPSSQDVHLISLLLITLSTILLMTPAAYHRLVEKGENTEEFHRFASHVVLAAMAPLGLGICGDFLVVVRKVTGSLALAIISAAALLAFFYGLWFGFTWYRRAHPKRAIEGRQS